MGDGVVTAPWQHASMSITHSANAVSQLRGEPSRRPRIDRALAGGLRAWLNDELFEIFGEDSSTKIVRSPWSLTHRSAPHSTLGIARGALVGALFTQRLLGGDVVHPMDDALCVLEADQSSAPLTHEIHQLDPDRFALLAAEVNAHDAVLAQQLRPVPSTWLPRFGVSACISLHGGQLTLRATTDAMLGPAPHDIASVALLEVTTASHDELIQQELKLRALIETLRAGTQPFAVASLSSATGELALLEVREHDLVEAVHAVVAATKEALHG